MKQQAVNTLDNPLASFAASIDAIPLKIGAPSYVFPAGYAANVEMLRCVFDEIQLLVLETMERTPLDEQELTAVRELKGENLSYSVHLPVPGLTAKGGGARGIIDVMKKFEPVGVENYILHVENSSGTSGTDIARRIDEIVESSGVEAERICVENLQEGFDEVWERVEPAGVSICFDVGHLLFAGGDPMDFIDRYGGRIRMAHIHGADVKDHRPLSAMPKGLLEKILGRFMELKLPGAVIIENYSVEEMRQSLSCLSEAAGKLRAA